jgi:hypothetical protein
MTMRPPRPCAIIIGIARLPGYNHVGELAQLFAGAGFGRAHPVDHRAFFGREAIGIIGERQKIGRVAAKRFGKAAHIIERELHLPAFKIGNRDLGDTHGIGQSLLRPALNEPELAYAVRGIHYRYKM